MFETVVRRIRDDNERAVCYHDVEEPQGRLITIVTTQRSDRMAIKESKVFLTEILNQQQRQKTDGQPRAGEQPEKAAGHDDGASTRMIETRIYVGLNDADTKAQKHETEKYINILKNVCRNYHVAFSVDIEQGGYFHDDGEYTEEPDRKIVREIAKDLCTFFHQESVLVTEDHIKGYFITQTEE